ncbi:MAG: hypothetical protein A3E83_00790 [Gammaproteobacteria bacterium RIFCSPHIGHO2_12_FULL_41_20]|nr:MAG: hypothetical protein A3E83_00790 [Gammaproteobacteria bacterium RIFCSPHIGHO2_12_FULL_41_20]
MRHVVLCADDYGQNLAISQGIIALLQASRLSATSCLTNADHWLDHAKWLLPFQGKLDIGMHFNLTEGNALSTTFSHYYGSHLFSLGHLMMRAYARQLNQAVIEDECCAQLERFVSATGMLPDFIDGHQHVHQLPIVREAMLNVCAKRLCGQHFYVRCVNDRLIMSDWLHGCGVKKSLILVGTCGLRRLLQQAHIPYNTSFSGIYVFNQAQNYATLFPRFLDGVQDGGLIMCHPGMGEQEGDPIGSVRGHEYRYFSGEQFLKDCRQKNVVISRFFAYS